eukprot:TRINITY_DN27540_c0_g1_i1.p1 TRINITY_DN27540_c0_g1~~TRINITY_DN27540_c0_g1_i1.p1  ORF type:complete len:234 (-),score=24.59 TRINITY_DN27540_c0_g1_i1:75-749(-)
MAASVAFCAPLSKCKVVHFLRHAEAESNAAAHAFPRDSPGYNAAYADQKYFDSALSAKGEAQCKDLRDQISLQGLSFHCEAVFCSPLHRTLQTASQVFENRSIPWMALEVAREYSQGHNRPCDCRRSKADQQANFSFVDFQNVPDGEDTFAQTIESEEDLDKRCVALLDFLRQRSESAMAVVSHTGFLTHLFAKHLQWPGGKEKAAFSNCELRSVVIRYSDDSS